MIETKGLTKRFGDIVAVDHIDAPGIAQQPKLRPWTILTPP